MPRWALPDYVEDILPPEAMAVERVRRTLIDTCVAHHYQLVQPPLIEYVDSLTGGTGELDDHMFKVIDQLSGKLLGVRADMTPQAARIDAHLFSSDGAPNRLCYVGSVLHTQPTALNATREVVQGGAEIYGVPGIEGDLEMLRTLLAVLHALDLPAPHIDLGHAAIFGALSAHAQLEPHAREAARFALQRKDRGALHAASKDAALALLLSAYGEANEVLRAARATLPGDARVVGALDELQLLSDALAHAGARVTIDLADVPNYDYHTGIVFSAYVACEPIALARGGRYNNIGAYFGAPRPRPATGFSLDVRLAAAAVAAQSNSLTHNNHG